MTTYKGANTIGILVALAMAAAACASAADPAPLADNDAEIELAADATTTVPAASSSTSEKAQSPGAPERTETAAPTVVPERWLENLTSTPPNESGWPVDAGEWATNAFTHPVVFDLPDGLAVRDHGPFSIRLNADRPDTVGQIHLVRSSTLTLSNGSSVPVPKSVEEAAELIETTGTSTLIDHGTIDGPDGEIGWWKLEVDADIPATACLLGDTCVMLAAASSGDPVEIVTGEPLVIFRYFGEDARFAAYVTGPPGELEPLVEATEHIMTSFTPLVDSEAEPPPADTRFVSALGTGNARFESGTYHRMFGQTAVEFRIDEPIEGLFARHSAPDILVLSIDGSDLAIIAYERSLVDPTLPQARIDPMESRLLPRLAEPPADIDGWAAYADHLGRLTNTGSSEVGGAEVPWFEFEIEPGTGFDCWPGFSIEAEECIEFLTTWAHSDGESDNRHFVFGEERVLAVIYPDPDLTIDEVMTTWQPLLDTLSVSRLG